MDEAGQSRRKHYEGQKKKAKPVKVINARKKLEVIKKNIPLYEPDIQEDGPLYQNMLVLLAASRIVGADIGRLTEVTKLPGPLVADIYYRMQEWGDWEVDGSVWFGRMGRWFEACRQAEWLVEKQKEDGYWSGRNSWIVQ